MYLDEDRDREGAKASIPEATPDPKEESQGSVGPEPLRRFLIRRGDKAFFLATESIRWIEADGDFVRLHTASKSHRIRATLSALYERLNQGQFLRINRSAIVNIDFVAELHLRSGSGYDVVLRDGTVLRFSRIYSDSLRKAGGVFGCPGGGTE